MHILSGTLRDGRATPDVRILMIHSNFPSRRDPRIVGGAEVSVTMLAEGLAGFDDTRMLAVRGIAPEREGYGEKGDAFDLAALPIRRPHWVYDDKPRSMLAKGLWHALDDKGATPRSIDALLERFRPDVALLHNVTGIGWRIAARLKAAGVPVIQTLHDYYFLCARMTRFRGGRVCAARCLDCRVFTARRREIERHVDAVVGVSQSVLDVHMAAGLFNQVPIRRVIHNGIDVRMTPVQRDWPELRMGFLGRIAPEKGLELLAAALSRLPAETRLVIAGKIDDAARTALQRIAGREITFLGFVSPEALFREIDVLVVPSLWDEPFGRVSVEAQAFGVPSVVSSRGGLPGTIGGGQVGWVFEPDAPETLDAILGSLARDKRLIAARAANIPASITEFSCETYIRNYRALIDEVLENAG